MAEAHVEAKGMINPEDVFLCAGCFCCFNGFYFDDNCFGCGGDSEFLCCVTKCCFQTGTPLLCCDTPEGHCCQLGCGICSYGCKSPGCSPCMKNEHHFCCFAHSCILPPNDTVPWTLALYGLACLPGFGCCAKVSTLKEGGGFAICK